MARNYQPSLRAILHTTQVYVARYQPSLEEGMTAEQVVALLAFIQCLIDLVSALGPNPIED